MRPMRGQLRTGAADAALVTAARGGSAQAREGLFRRQVQPIHDLVFALCGRLADPNEVTLDVFRELFGAGLSPLPHGDLLRPWILRTVVRVTLRRLARPHLRARLRLRPRPAPWLDALLAQVPPASQAEWQKAQTRLDRLPLDGRAALLLHDLGGLSLAEIAFALDAPVKRVRRLLTRAQGRFDPPRAGTPGPLLSSESK